jgi:hypothetical protein
MRFNLLEWGKRNFEKTRVDAQRRCVAVMDAREPFHDKGGWKVLRAIVYISRFKVWKDASDVYRTSQFFLAAHVGNASSL